MLLMQKPLLLLIPEACGVWTLAPVTLCWDELILHDAVTGLKLEESKHVQLFDGINNAWWS